MSSVIKLCFVPYCTNTSKTIPNKKFVTVPKTTERRKTWFEAVRRTFKASTNYYCCEDHFDLKVDQENYMECTLMGGKIFLKKDVVPHIFNWPGGSSIKKRKLEIESVPQSEPSTSWEIYDTGANVNKIDVGIQNSVESKSVYRQTNIEMKHVAVSCDLKLLQANVKVDTTSLIDKRSVATTPLQKKMKFKETSGPEEVEVMLSSSDFIPQSDSSDTKKTVESDQFKQILNLIEKYPKRYIGVPKIWYPMLIDTLCKNSKLDKEHVLLCLMKVKLNDSFARLADQFLFSIGGVSKIFRNNIYKIDYYFSKFIFWPEQNAIKKNLPIPFRANYGNVQSIIDCLEIQIEKPTNPIHQALTWSQYKKCNTIKYLISCTPDGFINFISSGYGGRISDTLLTQQSNYLNVLPNNSVVMADRGFKDIAVILQKKSCILVRPPSVSSTTKPTKNEVMETKRIASLRIHVERVIGRLTEFAFSKPHSVIDHNLIFFTDVIIRIACTLSNLQSPLIRS